MSKRHLRVLKVANRDAQFSLETPNFHISNTITFYPMAQSKYLGFKAGEIAMGSGVLAPSEHLGLTCNTHMVVDNHP